MIVARDIAAFLDDPAADTHVVIQGLSLVMRARKECRPLVGRFARLIILSTIEVEATRRGQGGLTRFLDHNEPLAHELGVVLYIEDVLNARLAGFLDRRGWTAIVDPKDGLCYAHLCEGHPGFIEPRLIFPARAVSAGRLAGGRPPSPEPKPTSTRAGSVASARGR